MKETEQEDSSSIRQRIELAMTIVEQNDELSKMIGLIGQQFEE